MAQPETDVNVLLLGESGSGKSTFINSLANYLQYETLQEAMDSKPECLISTSFTMADENYEDRMVSIEQRPSKLCSPGQTFDDICEYKYHLKKATFRVIDTPAVGDARGVDQDKENVKKIVSVLSNYSHLNAIVFLLKSNVTIVSEYFKFSIRYLLSLVDESAFDNIVFVLTHSQSTFFKPGETMTHLKALIKVMNVDIPCDKSNIFCVDNETFRYLVASYKGMNFTPNEMTTFSKSWDRSRDNSMELLKYISRLKVQKIGVKLTRKYSQQMLDDLGPLLCNLVIAFGLNLKILEDLGHSEKVGTKIWTFTIDKATADYQEAMICQSLKCSFVKVNNSNYMCDKKVCHKPCCCNGNMDGKAKVVCKAFGTHRCTNCFCETSLHKRTKTLRVLNETILPSNRVDRDENVVKAISGLEYERDLAIDALAHLHLHGEISHDYVRETLNRERSRDYDCNKAVYSSLMELFEQKVLRLQETNANIDRQSVQSAMDALFNCKMAKKVLNKLFGKEEETKGPIKEEKSEPVKGTSAKDEFSFEKYTSAFDKLLLNMEAKAKWHRQLKEYHEKLEENAEKLRYLLTKCKTPICQKSVDEPVSNNTENSAAKPKSNGRKDLAKKAPPSHKPTKL